MNKIENKLNKIFSVVFNLKEKNIKNVTFENVKKWDSMGHLNLILAIESSFKIKVNPEDSIDFLSYKKIYNYLIENNK
mgnify:CR=1 FL=1